MIAERGAAEPYQDMQALVDADYMAVYYASDAPRMDTVTWQNNAEHRTDLQNQGKPYGMMAEIVDDGEVRIHTYTIENDGLRRLLVCRRPANLEEMTAFAMRLQAEEDPRAHKVVEHVKERISKAAADLGIVSVAAAKEE